MEKIQTLGPDLHPDSLDSPTYVPEPKPRTVTIHPDNTLRDAIAATTGREKLFAAIGYLATWGAYPIVDIYHDGKADLVAVYKNDDLTRGYTIGAVWSDSGYSFHS